LFPWDENKHDELVANGKVCNASGLDILSLFEFSETVFSSPEFLGANLQLLHGRLLPGLPLGSRLS